MRDSVGPSDIWVDSEDTTMPQPVALSVTTPPRNFPERIVIDETERAEQFAAFLRARVGEDSPAPGRAADAVAGGCLRRPALTGTRPRPSGFAARCEPGSGDATCPGSIRQLFGLLRGALRTETEPVSQPNIATLRQDVQLSRRLANGLIGPYQQPPPEEFGFASGGEVKGAKSEILVYRFRALETASRVGAQPAHRGVLGGFRISARSPGF